MTITASGPDTTDVVGYFLAAVPARHRGRVEVLLSDRRCGGGGLRAMLNLIHTDQRPVPDALPAELIAIYLADDEAEPLHDCERCGLRVPVHPRRHCGHDATVEGCTSPRARSAGAAPGGSRTGRTARATDPAGPGSRSPRAPFTRGCGCFRH